MTEVNYTEGQLQAIQKLVDWYKSLKWTDDEGQQKLIRYYPDQENRDEWIYENQIFRLFGYAGTGKTTITMAAIQALGLNVDNGVDVKFAAYTGKAAYVMRKHGTPATTIASLAYSVLEATEEAVEAAKVRLNELKQQALEAPDEFNKQMYDQMIGTLEAEIREMKKPHFQVNPESEITLCKLLVLDEVSMVNEEQAKDLMSFGKPILVLGDPGQLPPIKGEGAFTTAQPDSMLTEIHRQAAESPIIRLATMARTGKDIPYGNYGPGVAKVYRNQIDPAWMLNADQVICGRNATRLDLNGLLRKLAGFDTTNPFPTSEKEKVICLKNSNTIGLVNGMFITLHGIQIDEQYSDTRFRAKIKSEDGDDIGYRNARGQVTPMSIYAGHFLDHVEFKKDRNDEDWKIKKGLVEATFGWVVTCHKFQGSQGRNIVVIDDKLGGSKQFRRQWLYTAFTRPEEGLLIID